MASPRYESPSGTVTKYKLGKTELLVFSTVLAVFLVLFYLYCKWRRWCSNATATRRTRSSVIFRRSTSRLVFGPNHNYVTAPSKGLDPLKIQLLSSTAYNADDSSDEVLQCAVCLSDVTEGEMIRLLPRCNHGFHVECIDMWFFSHSTCPLCRKTVVAEQANTTTVTPVREVIPVDENSVESSTIGSSSSSTNVNLYEELKEATTLPLSTASSTFSSTASKEMMMLTIEIPARDFSLEDTKPKSAMTGLGSLKRLLSIRTQKRWLKTSYSFSSTRSCISPTVRHDDGIPHVAMDIADDMH